MSHEKFSVFLANQNRRLRTLGIYAALVLLIFSLLAPRIAEKITFPEESAGTNPPATAQFAELEQTVAATQPAAEVTSAAKVQPAAEPQPSAKEQPETTAVLSAQVDISKITKPLEAKVTRGFGLTYDAAFRDYRYHNGIDLGAEKGASVQAVLPGRVVSRSSSKEEKVSILLDHGQGWRSEYEQMGETQLKDGDPVRAGQTVGVIAQNHLHFTLYKDGQAVDPLAYLP